MHYARSRGWLTPPYYLGDYSYKSLLCKDDCIFCHCPFYATNLLDEIKQEEKIIEEEIESVEAKKKNLENVHLIMRLLL